jgi:putative serine protease PepD
MVLVGTFLGVAALVAAAAVGIAVTKSGNGNQPVALTSGGPSACSATTVADRVLPSVVTISVRGPRSSGTGSGSILDTDGHILTNDHVISAAAGGGSISVTRSDGTSAAATIVGRDPQTDVAVIQAQGLKDLAPIAIGSSAQLQVGQPVIALGAPLGLSSTVTAGIVSALGRSVEVPSDGVTALLVSAIQTDAAINPGNSGGALVDCAGHLVGMPSAGATVPSASGDSGGGSIGLGFAVPSDFAKSIADELVADGKANHAYFGLQVATVRSDQGSGPDGLYVVQATVGGPAYAAGLRVGDVIVKIDGADATSAEQLLTITLTKRPGDTVPVEYRRDGADHTATITLGQQPLL